MLAAVGVPLEHACECRGAVLQGDWVRFYTYSFYYRLCLNSKKLFIHPCIPLHWYILVLWDGKDSWQLDCKLATPVRYMTIFCLRACTQHEHHVVCVLVFGTFYFWCAICNTQIYTQCNEAKQFCVPSIVNEIL